MRLAAAIGLEGARRSRSSTRCCSKTSAAPQRRADGGAVRRRRPGGQAGLKMSTGRAGGGVRCIAERGGAGAVAARGALIALAIRDGAGPRGSCGRAASAAPRSRACWGSPEDRGGDPHSRRALGRPWPPATGRGRQIPVLGRSSASRRPSRSSSRRRGRRGLRVAADRRGPWFDPALVEALEGFPATARSGARRASADVVGAGSPRSRAARRRCAARPHRGSFRAGIDAKSPWTYRHSELVADRSGHRPSFSASTAQIRDLRRAALLHDIGKLGDLEPRARQAPPLATRRAPSGASTRLPRGFWSASRASARWRRSPPRTTSASTAAATRSG